MRKSILHELKPMLAKQILIISLMSGALAAGEQSDGLDKRSAGGEFAVRSQTIDSVSSDSSGDDFRIRSTLGQGDVGVSSGGKFRIAAGFWVESGASDFIFFDSFE